MPPKMLMNGFNLPSVQPPLDTTRSTLSMETVGSPPRKRHAVSPVSVGSDDSDGGGLRKKRRKIRKTTIRTKTKTKTKTNNANATKTRHKKTNIKKQN